MKGLIGAVRDIFRLAVPYFKSEERWFALGMLAILVGLTLLSVYIQVLITTWNLRFFNALQARNVDEWLHQLSIFFLLGCSVAVTLPLQGYCNQLLQIRWRRWMTDRYLSDWLRASNHYRMQLRGNTDNPDQRISIDIQMFISSALVLGLGFLRATVALFSFIFILWGISAHTPLPILGHDYSFPGYLVFAAMAVAVGGTLFTHLIGRKLIGLNFNQQRYEADFRFSLVRVRENSEQIALLQGEPVAQVGLMNQFSNVVSNWKSIMGRTLKLGFFTGAFGQISFLLPSLLIAPSFLSGASRARHAHADLDGVRLG